MSVILLLTPALGVSGRSSEASVVACQSEIASDPSALLKVALTLCRTGDHVAARDRLAEAMRMWMQRREPDKAARSSLLMGDAYRRMKLFQESLDYYKQALEVKPLSSQVRALAFNAIAGICAELYQLVLARRYYAQAVAQARIARDVAAQEEALIGLAKLCYQSRDLQRALAFIEQARRLNRQPDDVVTGAALLHLTGRIATEQRLTDEARVALNAALTLYQQTGNAGEQTRVLCSISDLYRLMGQDQAALDHAQQAVDLADSLAKQATSSADKRTAWDWRWHAWFTRARALRALGQKAMAAQSYFRAVNYMEAFWLSRVSVTDVGAMAYGEERQAIYHEYADLLIEQGKIDEGFNVTEQVKARALLGLIAARRTTASAIITDQQGKLTELSRSIASLRTQLLASPISMKQRAKIEQEIEESEFALEEAQAEAEMKQAGKRMAWFWPVAVGQVQQRLNPDRECMLEFFLGERRSFAWLISSNDVSLEILPGRQEIEKAVTPFLAAINTKPNNLYLERRLTTQQELAEKLCDQLFGQLAGRLAPGKRLIVVPDGILYYLPFETLRHNGRYLVEDHEISYLPSAGLLELLRDSKSQAETGDKLDLLAFGDPVFSPEGVKPKRGGDGIAATRQVLSAMDGFHLDALPRTRDEVEEIAKLFAPDRCRVFLGKESTEEAVKAAPLRRYKRLHFATHGLLNERNSSRSAIVLTLDNDPHEDGFLEVGEIAKLNLDCDLVVLSACQTGRGQLFSGEGIVGLSRAFLYAGAGSVVVSLWNVSDISTSELMKSFYQHLINNMGNAAALREAKLQMLRSGNETRHPYYWAPFIVVGKP
jgi:CHAT domain-containing protein